MKNITKAALCEGPLGHSRSWNPGQSFVGRHLGIWPACLSISEGSDFANASRARPAAHRSSWPDCLAMVKARHPPVAAAIVDALENDHPGLHFRCALAARECLLKARFDVPGCEALADGLRPDDEGFVEEPRVPRHGVVMNVSSKGLSGRACWVYQELCCALKAVLSPVCPSPAFLLLPAAGTDSRVTRYLEWTLRRHRLPIFKGFSVLLSRFLVP